MYHLHFSLLLLQILSSYLENMITALTYLAVLWEKYFSATKETENNHNLSRKRVSIIRPIKLTEELILLRSYNELLQKKVI